MMAGKDSAAGPLNAYLLRSALVAALGGLLFGFDTAVIAGTTQALTAAFQLTPALLGFTVSSALWGTGIGIDLRGRAERQVRASSLSSRLGGALRGDGAGLRLCLELVCTCVLPRAWRPSYRGIISYRPYVYRRDLAG